MKPFSVSVLVILLCCAAGETLANGGPTDWSNTIGTGNPNFTAYRSVTLQSEKLTIKPGMNYIDVEAVYTLHNTGDEASIDFAFPVDLVISEHTSATEGVLVEDEIPRFEVFLDGLPLACGEKFGINTDPYIDEYGNERDVRTVLFTTSFDIAGMDTVELAVSYSFKAWYEDLNTSKDFFTWYGNRSFRYVMQPAGFWGDGVVEKFDILFDFTEILENGGYTVSLPGEGSWVANGLYAVSKENYDFTTAPDLEVEYNVHSWGASQELLPPSFPSVELVASASSTLPSQNGITYSPDNLLDRNLSTAWAESAAGYEGEWIEFQIDPPAEIAFLGLIGGYTKSSSLYAANARPRTVTFEIHGEHVETGTVVLEDIPWESVENGVFYNIVQSVFQRGMGIDDTALVRFRFIDAYPGNTYDDLCVSEVFIGGWCWGDI